MLWARSISGMSGFDATHGAIYGTEANTAIIEELAVLKEGLVGQQGLNWRIMSLSTGLCCIIWVRLRQKAMLISFLGVIPMGQ